MITRIQPLQINLDQLRLVSLALQDESVVLGKPATVQIQVNEETIATVTAEVVNLQDTNGDWYAAVKLTFKEVDDGRERVDRGMAESGKERAVQS